MEGNHYKKGLWTLEEDNILVDYINIHGEGHWNRVAKATGLKRCGKSCRLRWMNYLCPRVKRGDFSQEEEDLIIRLHNLLGNRWALIAGRVPGRTDNQVKNYWNTHLSKKLGMRKTKRSSSMTYCNLNASSSRFTEEGGDERGDPKNPRVPVLGTLGLSADGGRDGAQVRESTTKASEMKNEKYLSSSWLPSDNSCLKSPFSMEFQDASLLGNMDVWYDSNFWF